MRQTGYVTYESSISGTVVLWYNLTSRNAVQYLLLVFMIITPHIVHSS
jgi:hypothetical protein